MTAQKNRHGCLTAWLIFIIATNSIIALISLLLYTVGNPLIEGTLPANSSWFIPVSAALCIFNVICAVALFRWKKWGFWGFLGSSVAAFVINLSIGEGIVSSLVGFLGVVILYGVLNIGEQNKGWSQLD